MPEYPWFFDGSPDRPNERGLAMITYVQWLGSWLESYPYYEDFEDSPLAGVEVDTDALEAIVEPEQPEPVQ